MSEPANRFTLSLFGKVNVLKKIEFNSNKDNNNKNYWFLSTKLYTNILQNMNKWVRAALYQMLYPAKKPTMYTSTILPIIKEKSM